MPGPGGSGYEAVIIWPGWERRADGGRCGHESSEAGF